MDSSFDKLQKDSIFNQSGLNKILNANLSVGKEILRALDPSTSLQYTNFKDMAELKKFQIQWKQKVTESIKEKQMLAEKEPIKEQLQVLDFMQAMTNSKEFQDILLKELQKNSNFRNDLKKLID